MAGTTKMASVVGISAAAQPKGVDTGELDFGSVAKAVGRYALATTCAGLWAASMWNLAHLGSLQQAFWLSRIPPIPVTQIERYAVNRWVLLGGCTLPLLVTCFLAPSLSTTSGFSLEEVMHQGGYWAGIAGAMAVGVSETEPMQQRITKKLNAMGWLTSRSTYLRNGAMAAELAACRYDKNLVALGLALFGLGLMFYSISAGALRNN